MTSLFLHVSFIYKNFDLFPNVRCYVLLGPRKVFMEIDPLVEGKIRVPERKDPERNHEVREISMSKL